MARTLAVHLLGCCSSQTNVFSTVIGRACRPGSTSIEISPHQSDPCEVIDWEGSIACCYECVEQIFATPAFL